MKKSFGERVIKFNQVNLLDLFRDTVGRIVRIYHMKVQEGGVLKFDPAKC